MDSEEVRQLILKIEIAARRTLNTKNRITHIQSSAELACAPKPAALYTQIWLARLRRHRREKDKNSRRTTFYTALWSKLWPYLQSTKVELQVTVVGTTGDAA